MLRKELSNKYLITMDAEHVKILDVLINGGTHSFNNNIRLKGNLKKSLIEMYIDKIPENSFELTEKGFIEALDYKKIFDNLAVKDEYLVEKSSPAFSVNGWRIDDFGDEKEGLGPRSWTIQGEMRFAGEADKSHFAKELQSLFELVTISPIVSEL